MSIYFSNKIDEIQYRRCKNQYSMADFKKSNDKFKSTNSVSLIYYPYQRFFPTPHAELEIEGHCYNFFWCCRKTMNLSDKIKNSEIKPLRVRPFVRIGISVSPKQLTKLKSKINKFYFSITCMKAISNILDKYADFYIPFPLSFSPTFSAGYLYARKAFDSSRITSITSYPSSNSLNSHRPLVVNAYKAGVYTYSCLSIAIECFILYNIPKVVFEKSHLIHAVRSWAASRFSPS